MAAALLRRGKRPGRSRKIEMQEQLRQEASALLSTEAIGTRMSQIDRIIKRKASNVLFSLETSNDEENSSSAKRSSRLEHLAQEFLYRVQARRKRARSYFYLTWFLVFFAMYLLTQFMKEDNGNLYTVDISIKTRIVDILPQGHLNGDSDFYNWLSSTIQDIFQATVCGNGICERPEEYPGFGRFGCQIDCGHFLNRTTIRVNLSPVWNVPGPLAPFKDKLLIGSDGNLPIGFSYNIYSDTMQGYILSKNSMLQSNMIEVPDGNFRLEIYQNVLTTTELTLSVIADYSQTASQTLPARDYSLPSFQYGDPAEVFGTAASLNLQVQDFCQYKSTSFPDACANISKASIPFYARYFLDNYGLFGSVQVVHGSEQVLATIPFCSFSRPGKDVFAQATMTCPRKTTSGSSTCYDAAKLAQSLSCQAAYNFSVWSWGPPRTVKVKSTAGPVSRKITPFNNLIGGLIMTQFRRKESDCPVDAAPQTQALVNQFHCQTRVRTGEPFGMDPTFVAGSPQYAGQLPTSNYYSANELRGNTSLADKKSPIPFGFFPHEWGKGGTKPPEYIHSKDVGTYKLYWDTRLSSATARNLTAFLQSGAFMDELTDTIELEMVTYNPEYAVFGVATFQFNWDLGGNIKWDYQYNTVLMSPYGGKVGMLRMATDIVFGIMLLVDIIREAKDVYDSFRRDQFVTHYLKSLFKYVNWVHYMLIIASLATWIEFNVISSALVLQASYPVLANLDAPARPFLTIPDGETNLLNFVDKLRSLCEIKNRFAAYNVLSTLIFIARVLKILDFQPRMALITRTLRQAGVDLVHFLLLFIIVVVGYAVTATLLLGGQLQEFNSIDSSVIALFFLFLGWEPKYSPMLAAIQTRRSNFAVFAFQLFYWSFIVIATFVLLNVVLAIIVEAYAACKRKNENCQTMGADILEIAGDSGTRIYNRLFESELLISDRKLEKVLVDASKNQGLQLRKKKKKEKGPNALRLPGGLQLTAKDLSILLKTSGTKGHTLLRRMSVNPSQWKSAKLALESESVDAESEEEGVIPRPIQDVINRYEQRVDEVKEEHDFFHLLKAEGLKRQIALYTFMDEIKQQVDDLNVTLSFVASNVLSEEEKTKLLYDKLITAAQSNKLNRSVDVGELFTLSDGLSGELKITIVAVKNLVVPISMHQCKPYCIILLQDETVGAGDPEILARTPNSVVPEPGETTWGSTSKGEQNVWNTSYQLSIEAHKRSLLVVAVLDEETEGDESLFGIVSIPLANARLGEESDKWYRLHRMSDLANHEAMLRLRIKFTAHQKCRLEGLSELGEGPDEAITTVDKQALREKMQFIQNRLKEICTETFDGTPVTSVDANADPITAMSPLVQHRAAEKESEAANPTACDEIEVMEVAARRSRSNDIEISASLLQASDRVSGPMQYRKRMQSGPPDNVVDTAFDQMERGQSAQVVLDGSQPPSADARPSVHLDSNQAFAFRSNVRARLELMRKLTKELNPIVGEKSYKKEQL